MFSTNTTYNLQLVLYSDWQTVMFYSVADSVILQGGTGTSMLVDGGDAGNAGALNLMEEDRVSVFGGRSKRRR